jgi:hypothetical protein
MAKLARWFLQTAAVAVVCCVSVSQSASALSAEVAKTCREQAIKSHPPAVAGSRAGTAQAERDFFQACVARGGKVDDDKKK